MRRVLARLGEFARAAPGEMGVVALLAAVVLSASALIYARTSEPPPPPMRTLKAPGAERAKGLVVHVAGMVASPGVYELPEGSRVRDAIAAAGGPADGADLDALNLAARLVDGEKVFVPRPGAAPDAGAGESSAKVNLNAATQAQLEELPGVGPVLARRIIEFRERRGPFRSTRQLLEVEGFGPKKYEALRDLVTV